MAKKYNQGVTVASTRFTKAPMGEIEYSRMYAEPSHTTTFNAGDIVPIYCNEVLPHDTFSVEVDEIIRQATLKVPSMDRAIIDVFAYFVPNRVVNKSWKNVMGENTSSAWIAPKVSLAPLYDFNGNPQASIQVPVGSVADYYGFPTQKPIPTAVLQACNDLKFRGYLEIYNNYFRDQNYQPPIPYSKLNVYNAFFQGVGFLASLNPSKGTGLNVNRGQASDGSYGAGAVMKEVYGEGENDVASNMQLAPRYNGWSALTAPLKANKLHDYFTSVLPSPQKGEEVVIGLGEVAPVTIDTQNEVATFESGIPFRLKSSNALSFSGTGGYLGFFQGSNLTEGASVSAIQNETDDNIGANSSYVNGSNLVGFADLSQATGVSINDLRMSAAVQQVYEILGRGGSRYTEYINSFFGLDIDNPFDDIPTCLGHIRRDLDLYQTAQTSASTEDSPQGNLSAFGYTSTGGHLFERTFLEHGYIHILAVVRHKNIYSSLMTRDNFRMSLMDFYQYPLANISEQPVYTREINPYVANPEQVFGYQEAWSEYRMEPDRVSGYIRPGIDLSLDFWSYADDFDDSISFADGEFMESNSQAVIARGTSSSEEYAPQFKGKFIFKITKQRPMPTYSMSGLDII